MGKVLVVAEKPSVGRDIARVLGCRQKGEGCLIGEHYVVTWAIGHLVSLAEPQDYDEKYKKWSMDTLPILPQSMKLKPISKTRKQYSIIKKWMNEKEIDSIICATDSGREGELIFRYIYQSARCKKPVQRLWISSMTDEAIHEGFSRLKPGRDYDQLYESARCRSEADWLVGMNASRAYTIRYSALLSIGRVQTPTLALLVEKQKEINAFVPQDYWEVEGFFEDYKGLWYDAKLKETRITDARKAEEIAAKVKGKTGQVKDIEGQEKKQLPPLLYDLTELQRDGNRKFGFSAQKTLSIAQDLYEKRKLITYPRTDSRYLSKDMVPKVKTTLKKLELEPYQKYVQVISALPKLPVSKRIVDDAKVTDHHAIIPTDKHPKLDTLTPDERKIYDLIVRRLLAVFYPPYITYLTKVITQAEGEAFLSKGKTVLQWGWMELYKDDRSKTKEEEQEMPSLQVGDERKVSDVQVLKKQTKAPNPYNEATLLSAMENAGRFVEDEELKEQLKESGLGTPATRAATIERLLEVGYIERKGKSLFPTEKGIKLIEIVPFELKSPETTGKWEKGLSSIAKGQLPTERFMESIKKYVLYLVDESAKTDTTVVFEKENPGARKGKRKSYSLGSCPVCGKGSILENSKGFYCTDWKQGCKFTLWKNSLSATHGVDLTAPVVKKLLKEGKTEIKPSVFIQLKDKTGTLQVIKNGSA